LHVAVQHLAGVRVRQAVRYLHYQLVAALQRQAAAFQQVLVERAAAAVLQRQEGALTGGEAVEGGHHVAVPQLDRDGDLVLEHPSENRPDAELRPRQLQRYLAEHGVLGEVDVRRLPRAQLGNDPVTRWHEIRVVPGLWHPAPWSP